MSVLLGKAPTTIHLVSPEDRAWAKTDPSTVFRTMAFALKVDELNDIRKGFDTP